MLWSGINILLAKVYQRSFLTSNKAQVYTNICNKTTVTEIKRSEADHEEAATIPVRMPNKSSENRLEVIHLVRPHHYASRKPKMINCKIELNYI